MMDKFFLRLIALFNPVFERTGVDTFQLNEILRVKLLIDSRRPVAMFAGRKRAATTSTSTSWRVMIFTLIIGALYGSVLFIFKKPLVGQTIYFSAFMVLMSLTLITDFTTVLIDVRDQFIIAPRPVNDRTVAIARILHVTIYVLRLALIQGLPGMIMIGYIDGIVAVPLFLIQVIMATLLSIFFVNMIYLLLMKSVSPQRFKDIISYFQIAFSILIFAAYQLLPRLIRMSVLADFDLLNHTWSYFLPPIWIAAINEVLVHGGRSNFITVALAFVGLTLPFISLWFVAKVLAPGFNKSLSMIAMSDGSTTTVQSKKVRKSGLIGKLANLVAPDPIENAGFRITWKLGARTREFKMKVYPQFAFIPVYFAYFTLSGNGDINSQIYKMQHGKSYIFLLYFSSVVLASILQQISQTEKYKAAWIYYAAPISKPGNILAGMFKAITTLYFLPYYLVLGGGCVAIWGPSLINDIILAFFLIQVYGIVMALFLVKGLPFSRPVLTKQAGGRLLTSLMIMGLAGVFGFCHYILSRWELVIWILIIPAIALYWVMFNYYRKQTWDNVELNEID
jgi:ABC-2 type transport system permease protein